jgi:Flp pilus assembly CpaF family ATPase
MAFDDVFDLTGQSLSPSVDDTQDERLEHWLEILTQTALERKAQEGTKRKLAPSDIEALVKAVFAEVSQKAADDGIHLPEEMILRLIGELSGFGPLLELIARDDIEDIAVNLGFIYIYITGKGWQRVAEASKGVGDAMRVMIDRAEQRAPTPDHPVADAMLQVMVPLPEGGVKRKGVRVNFIMPPASPYGDYITMRVSNYRSTSGKKGENLGLLCESRLPPVKQPVFSVLDFPHGKGVISPDAANYILAVMVRGGTIVISGTTGSGKTFVGQRILQEMLNFYPPGAIRLFIVEDSNEIILNGWSGDHADDTGNIVYTITRPEVTGGPTPVTMYDLIRAALRSRPHGLIIGEARGAEAWELVRAAATGHGHSAFTIHATSAEQVWPRFLQVVQAHPDAVRLGEMQIAQSFAEAVTLVVHMERDPQYGQIVRAIAEVSSVVERSAKRPAITPLFRFNIEANQLLPTGNRPMRPGFRAQEIGIPESYFQTQ